MESKLGEVCTHGQLKRQCPLCEIELECAAHKKARLEDEGRNSIRIDELRARIEELENENYYLKARNEYAIVQNLQEDVASRDARIKELEAELKSETDIVSEVLAIGKEKVTQLLIGIDRRDELLQKCLRPIVWLNQMDDNVLREEGWAVVNEILNDPYWKEILPPPAAKE